MVCLCSKGEEEEEAKTWGAAFCGQVNNSDGRKRVQTCMRLAVNNVARTSI